MHQHPRRSPTTSSPASTPRANPERSNRQREEGAGNDVDDSGGAMRGKEAFRHGDGAEGISRIQSASVQGRESVAKLSQIIQVR